MKNVTTACRPIDQDESFNGLLADVVEMDLPESEETEDDFLTRMKEIITANESVNHYDLERLIDLKGKGNPLAAELVEAFETSPEAPQGDKAKK